jgi:hypothetical protein
MDAPNYRLARRLHQTQTTFTNGTYRSAMHRTLPGSHCLLQPALIQPRIGVCVVDDADDDDDDLPFLGAPPSRPAPSTPSLLSASLPNTSSTMLTSSTSSKSTSSLIDPGALIVNSRDSSRSSSSILGDGAVVGSLGSGFGLLGAQRKSTLSGAVASRALAGSAPEGRGSWRRSSTSQPSLLAKPRAGGARIASGLGALSLRTERINSNSSSNLSQRLDLVRVLDCEHLEDWLASETLYVKTLGYCSVCRQFTLPSATFVRE